MAVKNSHVARVLALQALYELDCTTHPVEQVVSARLDENQIDAEQRILVYRLINGVIEHKSAIDQLIQQHATEFPLEQVAIIDRNILRIAIYEFAIWRDTPMKVAFNEAVELAKEFGSASASRFVNGVLGALSLAQESAISDELEGSST
mgnify:CR=1 FL=1